MISNKLDESDVARKLVVESNNSNDKSKKRSKDMIKGLIGQFLQRGTVGSAKPRTPENVPIPIKRSNSLT